MKNNTIPYDDILKHNRLFLETLQKKCTDDLWIKNDKEISPIYEYIKSNLVQTLDIKDIQLQGDLPELQQASSQIFNTKGKLMRPHLNFLVAQLLGMSLNDNLKIWSSVIEVDYFIHKRSFIWLLIKKRSTNTTHDIWEPKSYFCGKLYDWKGVLNIQMNSGIKLAEFNDIQMYQIYSLIMDNLTNGEYLQSKHINNLDDQYHTVSNYLTKTYYKTASLIANSLAGVSYLNKSNESIHKLIFEAGLHLGISFQIIDDVLDYTSTSNELGKASLSDLKSQVVTGPFKEGSIEKKLFANVISRGESKDQDYETVNDAVLNGEGIERSKYLAFLHAERGLGLLEQVKQTSCSNLDQILSITLYILTRRK